MISPIIDYLMPAIEQLNWVGKSAGLVKTFYMNKLINEDGEKAVYKEFRYPVACNVTHADCLTGKYKDLIPNSDYTSVVYFEDFGGRIVNTIRHERADHLNFVHKVRLVVWYNLNRFETSACSLDNILVSQLLDVIPIENHIKFDNYITVNFELQSIPVKDRNIFSRYVYDYSIVDLLFHPYNYFALDFDVNYIMGVHCPEPELTIQDEPC